MLLSTEALTETSTDPKPAPSGNLVYDVFNP